MNKLVFGGVEFGDKFPEFGKQEFYESKKAVKSSDVDVGKIVVSNKIKGNNETSKIFICYMDDTDKLVRPSYYFTTNDWLDKIL